ncbi:osmotically inducible protein OsmC [Intrasporangium oryzae NRRL B-24470]|uniref:Osmotically inducible protein OsmC n=1 Tax=Intrasporangium oryzae NRRL B-24470 TaxID=1386089 RepID=W9GC77_9MICO|nr:OsmC family protein [Intrasporangium oryzae]EWT02832.1 osmotically inducible protein OsmC [Intrasporangium oryzae NRRL B-24470]
MSETAVVTRPTVSVRHEGGDAFEIEVRGHRIRVDQPEAMGGEDSAPTPTELFVASLASCSAFYARRYLSRHHLPVEGLRVETTYEMATAPSRVSALEVKVHLPAGVPEDRHPALLAMINHCTVHSTLTHEPDVTIELVA